MHDPENVRLYDRPFRLMEISYPSRRDRERPTTDSAVVSHFLAFHRPRPSKSTQHSAVDEGLIDWANSRLPSNLQFTDICDCCGLNLTRIAESIKGTPVSPPVLDSWFPSGPDDGKLDGLFSLFAFLLSNDVRLGNVSINDIRLGEIDKTVLLLVLKLWEDKSTALSVSRG